MAEGLHLRQGREIAPVPTKEEYNSIRSEEVQALAEETDCDILVATPTTLLLDIDSHADLSFFRKQYERLKDHFPFKGYVTLKSRSGNWHVIVTLRCEMALRERIMLQAVMGSDRVRDALSLVRDLLGDEKPVLLLRPRSQS